MKKHGKKYRSAAEKIEKNKFYNLNEAVELIPQISTTAFDASIEIHMNLGIDPKKAEEQIRNTVSLPHGTGKTLKVIAFVTDDKIKEAMDNGAIKAGGKDLIAEVEKGFLDFDKAVAQPELMKDLAKIAKVLGPKGLMPSPKAGTVTEHIGKTVKELQGGRIEYRNDKESNIHNAVGKVSFGKEKILANIKEYLKAVKASKPSSMKGTYILTMTLTTTMGPGVPIDINAAMKEV
ncbi:50S ribosomal protein L1 [Candidatus Peregrinibacteria bacterium RIFOXYB2_FULL_32_7]|nr:MAG: 50S ribosomal protein L1 [Candidatus Peregrinibacteria bacterium RIFOXYB2_FULL_32_7]